MTSARPGVQQNARRSGEARRRVDTGVTQPATKVTAPARERRRQRVKLSSLSVPRRQHNMSAVRLGLRTLDGLIIAAVILVGVWNFYTGLNDNPVIAPLAAGLLGATIFITALRLVRAHAFPATETLGEHVRKVALACAAALGLWLALALVFRPETFQPDALARAGLVATVVTLGLHTLYHRSVSRLHRKGALAPTIVMLGATAATRRLIEHNATTRDLNIVAIFDERLRTAPHNIHGIPVIGTLEELLDWDELPYIDRIVVSLPKAAEARKREFAERVRLLPNRIAFVVDGFEDLDLANRSRQIAHIGLREWTGEPKPAWHTAAKRLMDIAIGGFALLLLAPFLLIIGLVIRSDSPGPALFKQSREGFNGRLFDVYKFRSLHLKHEDKQAASQVVAGDSRVTRIGRIIRKTSIDELPQLWNVVRGDMSLVGPRPHTPGMITAGAESRRLVAEYAHRHKVKPGMTGWAQIKGSRGPLHDAEGVAERVAYDIEYIENASIWWDIVIMAKTLPCLLGDAENIR